MPKPKTNFKWKVSAVGNNSNQCQCRERFGKVICETKKKKFLGLIMCFCDIKCHIFDNFFRTEFAKPYLLRFNKWYCFLELRLVHVIRSFLLNALLKEKSNYFKNAGFLRFFLKAFILLNSELSKIPFNFKRMDFHKKCLYL